MHKFFQYRHSRHHNRCRRPALYYWLAGAVLVLALGMPMLNNPFYTPAYAHHGGGGSGGGGGGGKGDGVKFGKPASTVRPGSTDGQAKGGRGLEGLKP